MCATSVQRILCFYRTALLFLLPPIVHDYFETLLFHGPSDELSDQARCREHPFPFLANIFELFADKSDSIL